MTIGADRDRYCYGMDTLFERHPDTINAPALLPTIVEWSNLGGDA